MIIIVQQIKTELTQNEQQINTINRQDTKLESANLFLEYGGTTGQEYFWQSQKYN